MLEYEFGLVPLSPISLMATAATRSVELVTEHFRGRIGVLADAQRDARPVRKIEKAWINVFGFSRGAAVARVFVHKFVNQWTENVPATFEVTPLVSKEHQERIAMAGTNPMAL